MEQLSPLTQQGERIRPDWTVHDWANGSLSGIFDATVRMSYETSDTGPADFTKTIVDQTVVSNGSSGLAVPKLRITNTSGLGGGNTRMFFPFTGSTCHNGEMRVLWLRRYRGTGVDSSAQCGLAMRHMIHPGTGSPWSFHYWHDGIFSIESLANVDTWRRNMSTGALIQGITSDSSGGGGVDLTGCQILRTVHAGSKQGTTITLNVGANHGIIVGDSCKIMTDEVDEGIISVTALPTSTTVQFTSGTSATNPIYNVGAGFVYNRSVQPVWVAARLIEDIFTCKMWRLTDSEPDWDIPENAVNMDGTAGTVPDTVGTMGITAAHLTGASHFVDYGTCMWRSLD